MRNEYLARQEEYIRMINEALEELLSAEAHPFKGEYDAVRQAMAYSVEAGGKRIRPVLTLETARIFGGEAKKALPLACAVELVHTYSLIHDDLPCMDDDDFRRGRPSCHKRFGYANALLAGDALLTLAFEVIASAPLKAGTDPAACLAASGVLARLSGIDGMVGGQVMDCANENLSVSEEALRQTYLRKTSALVMAACEMGALSAGAGEDAVRDVEEYARKLGLAFQIVDDILDVAGDEKSLGKPVGSDAASGKTTFVTLHSLEGAQRCAEQATRQALDAAAKLPDNGFLSELTKQLLLRRK